MHKKTAKLKTELDDNTNMYLQLITYMINASGSVQDMTARLQKIGKKKGHFWMFVVSLIFYSLKRLCRVCSKKTKQTVATGDLNITHFPVELKVAIYLGTQTRSN